MTLYLLHKKVKWKGSIAILISHFDNNIILIMLEHISFP